MATKTLYADGNSGIIAIGTYSANDTIIKAAAADPYSYLSNLNFHSGLTYLQIKEKIIYTPGITFAGLTREISYWEDAGSGGKGGGCCFIMLEARYGTGVLDSVVRRYRDEHITEKNKRGYYKLAEVFIPLMRNSKIFRALIILTLADPAVCYAKWYYGQNNWGWIFTPLKLFWMKLFNTIGTETEFIRENGEVV